MTKTTIHRGSCHCGALRYEVDLDLAGKATQCNCSICRKTMWTGAQVKPDALRVLSGEEEAGKYVWGGKVSTRFFCKTCGVHCYGRGELEMLGGGKFACCEREHARRRRRRPARHHALGRPTRQLAIGRARASVARQRGLNAVSAWPIAITRSPRTSTPRPCSRSHAQSS